MPAQWMRVWIGVLVKLAAMLWMEESLLMFTWWKEILGRAARSSGGGFMSIAMMRRVVGCLSWWRKKARPRPDEAPVMRIVSDMLFETAYGPRRSKCQV